MNKTRRDDLRRASVFLNEARGIVDACKDEEQEYFDAMPENLQGGSKGQRAEEVVNELDDSLSSIDEALMSIDNVL